MSSALVQKGLELVDPDTTKKPKGKKNKNVFNLMSDSQRITKSIIRNGKKEKHNLLSTTKKLTVIEAKKNLKSKDEILKANLKKLKQIREACRIDLDKTITDQIIERAVTKRPVGIKKLKPKKSEKKTAFTEEDFKKFEAEYFG